jgi:opacity protein-like surface antigen
MRKFLVVAVCLLAAPVVYGQGAAGTVELTPTVGYWFGDSLGRGSRDYQDYDLRIDDAPSYGLRMAYNFSDNWALEFMLARERADLVTGEDDLFGGSERLGNIDLSTAEVGFAVGFGHRRFVPFIAGGIGAMHLNPKISGMNDDTRFSANLGAGFKLYFSPNIALRFDWRGHSVDTGDDDEDCDWWDDCHDRQEWIRFSEVALGLSFAF